jgi:hypothetical protein
VWHIKDPQETRTYALTYREAKNIAKKMGWLKTLYWEKNGSYTNNNPGKKLCELLEKHKMNSASWRKKIRDR